MIKKSVLIIPLIVVAFTVSAQQHYKPGKKISDKEFMRLALTPPMGWNTWSEFGCNVSAGLLMEMADIMVSSGMKDAGYEYIVVDDCWQVGRDEEGNILPDPETFPDGMKPVVDYIHSLGLKFGLYSCAGSLTCQGRPGGRGYQFQDARQYAAWGVDYLKYDVCNMEGQNHEAAYRTMSDALKECGRPIVFSICEWGISEPWKWAKGIGHLWRTTYDISPLYYGKVNWGSLGFMNIIDDQAELWRYAGPGHWNDPDILEVGNGSLTRDENITHFSMWAISAAPLMAGNDLRIMSDEVKEILTNPDVIAINQDSLGNQAVRFLDMGDHEVWFKRLVNDELAMCFVNRSELPWKMDYNWKDTKIHHNYKSVDFSSQAYELYDVWEHKNIGTTDNNLKHTIPTHGVLMLKLTPCNKI
ncbi:MAG: glycoside hydrolase family 27 protein [Marinilabiliaceae bacterium]|jgi:alpha-galactosidase|nr:glycoside hydrolase family 27 protein [Marinilabiliaceae bacterium]